MGVPIRGKVATSQNDIIYRLFTTGDYRVSSASAHPSMDIQVASISNASLCNVGRDPPREGGHDDVQADRPLSFRHSTGRPSQRPLDAEISESFNACTGTIIASWIRTPRARSRNSTRTRKYRVVHGQSRKVPDTIREAIEIKATHPLIEVLKSRPIDADRRQCCCHSDVH